MFYGQYIVSEQYRPGWAQVAPPLYFDNTITPIKDDGYSWTNSYAQVGQLPYEYTEIELEMNVHHDNVGELHMWLETPGDGVTPGVRVPLTWTSQRDIQDRRTAEYRGYGFGVAQGDLLDLEDLGSTKFISRSDAGDIELAGALGQRKLAPVNCHLQLTHLTCRRLRRLHRNINWMLIPRTLWRLRGNGD